MDPTSFYSLGQMEMGRGEGDILWSAVTEEGRSFWRNTFSLLRLELGKEIWALIYMGLSFPLFAQRKLPFGQGIPEIITTTNSSANILILPQWAKISNWAVKYSQPPELQVFLRSSQTEVLTFLCFFFSAFLFLTILCCHPSPRIPSDNMHSWILLLWTPVNCWQCPKKTYFGRLLDWRALGKLTDP